MTSQATCTINGSAGSVMIEQYPHIILKTPFECDDVSGQYHQMVSRTNLVCTHSDKAVGLIEPVDLKICHTVQKKPFMVITLAINSKGDCVVMDHKYQVFLIRHTGEIIKITDTSRESFENPLVFSPNGKLIAFNTPSGHIIVLEIDTLQCIWLLRGDYNRISSIAFSPDNETIAFGSSYYVQLWNVVTGKKIMSISHNNLVRADSIAFNYDGTLLAIGCSGYLMIWDLRTSILIDSVQHHDYIDTVSFSPDGSKIVYTVSYSGIYMYYLTSKRSCEIINWCISNKSMHVAFFQGEKIMVSCGNNTLQIFETPPFPSSFASALKLGELLCDPELKIYAFAVSRDEIFAGTYCGQIMRWNVVTRVYNTRTKAAARQIDNYGQTDEFTSSGQTDEFTPSGQTDEITPIWSSR